MIKLGETELSNSTLRKMFQFRKPVREISLSNNCYKLTKNDIDEIKKQNDRKGFTFKKIQQLRKLKWWL